MNGTLDRHAFDPSKPEDAAPYFAKLDNFQKIMQEALAELHGAGIIHRDIKPSNLVLEESAAGTLRVRVLDLGIAKPFLFEAGADPYGAPLTLSGEMLGTPHYMSNEQLLGGYVDERRLDDGADASLSLSLGLPRA